MEHKHDVNSLVNVGLFLLDFYGFCYAFSKPLPKHIKKTFGVNHQ
jgi:hypothetical protein